MRQRGSDECADQSWSTKGQEIQESFPKTSPEGERGFRGAPTALGLFVVQLIANALWTWLFFVLHQGALSLAEIVVLWLLIAATISRFWPIDRLAALLLVPYLAWVSFASALTLSLWRLNPAVLG